MDNLWQGDRKFFTDARWKEPLKWARKASGRRPRVFCASMSDVFDNHQDVGPSRWRLWNLIRETPGLDWLLLTKRVGNVPRMLPEDWGDGYRNVWLGITVVNKAEVQRDVPKLQDIPAAVRFLSMEPLLEDIPMLSHLSDISWVIVGGESGTKARGMPEEWARHIRMDCLDSGVPFFMKQGSQANWPRFKDFESFPESLRVREWPKSALKPA